MAVNDILIVPDVHGRQFWEPALYYPGQIIFLGDYTDPYPSEGISFEQAYEVFVRIVEFKAHNPERVTLLIGNHELHYYDHEYACSRFSPRHYMAMHEILTNEATRDLFQVCKQVGRYLFSHAGILKEWYDCHYKELEPLGTTLEERINNFFRDNPAAFHEISILRNGESRCGSPLWVDIQEHLDATAPLDSDIMQVIGHTQMDNKEAYIKDSICLMDNRRLHLLSNGIFKQYLINDRYR